MRRTIQITVSTAGDLEIEAIGFKGPDCQKATEALEEALGLVKRRSKKAEYFQRTQCNNSQKLGE